MHVAIENKRLLNELYGDKFFLLGEITFTNLSYFSMKLKTNHFVLIYILDSMEMWSSQKREKKSVASAGAV